ncbi:hypothetical protein [Acinetobacter pollinis]|uniref:hypothetical protein n=1 Tax=Acinetobacter pollinis TaxID=2605270 RepID=UPI0018A24CF6|nr:hypothetical protein [Acinetobacter pollinis]MBF7689354.1 hypothetical protein [Acinetobacter pollinis]MBF7692001.1 hypothetical protein [Acinetobacter pollinis]MBF7697051.1 hypothetical protein [Acinetobacter pollinis]MBF7700442.1 hypothetical protein [Acinetobacter pollinis]
MIDKFEKIISQLHDARLFGFLIDINPNTMDSNLILYVQIFSDYDFNSELYSLEKALVVFECSSINRLSIDNDLSNGQFFITDIIIEKLLDDKFTFNFIFNDSSIELILVAENINLISSGKIEKKDWQFLPTNWQNLFN